MPPRYVYWTIIVDGQPTAFRSGSLEDIMPTFNRLKEKQPTAELKWFQNGQLWPSRHDAQEFVRARGERGRERDPRQNSNSARTSSLAKATEDKGENKTDDTASPRPERAWNAKPEWRTRSSFSARDDKPSFAKTTDGKPVWKPKGVPEKRPFAGRGDGPTEWAPTSGDKPAWKAKDDTGAKPTWRPKGDAEAKPAWKPKSASARGSFGDRDDRPAGQARGSKPPEWKAKGTFKPKEAGHAAGWGEKPGWKPKSPEGRPFAGRRDEKPTGGKPAWKAKTGGSARDQARSSFRPKSYTPKADDEGATRSAKARDQKLDWKPKAAAPRGDGPNAGFVKSDSDPPKRKWVPKAEYKKSLGIEVKRDDKWRPGGEHVDPKQKYKDAKKAKWTRVKATIRARSSKPRKPKDE